METIIYIALFSLLMSGAVIGAYNLLEGSDRNIVATSIQEEGTFLNRKINWALSGATGVTVSGGGQSITITRPDLGLESPLVISGEGSNATISRGTAGPVLLNRERYPVSSLKFVYAASINGRPASVAVSFLIKDKLFNFRKYMRQK